jgi:hypothetical protein
MHAVPKLLDMAEVRAGREGDNASVVAMTWFEEAASGDTAGISTVSMDPTDVKTTVEQFGKSAPPATGGYLTDDEIERAIDEIRNAIQKHSK